MSIFDKYKSVINNLAQNLLHREIITWHKLTYNVDYTGEGESSHFANINLRCLIEYNFRRTWPIDTETNSGSIDGQTICAIINLKYLKTLGYTDSNGYPIFNLGTDEFTHMGIKYISGGDSAIDQASDDPLLFQLILKRKTLTNG